MIYLWILNPILHGFRINSVLSEKFNPTSDASKENYFIYIADIIILILNTCVPAAPVGLNNVVNVILCDVSLNLL
jgi:hypothetical protein